MKNDSIEIIAWEKFVERFFDKKDHTDLKVIYVTRTIKNNEKWRRHESILGSYTLNYSTKILKKIHTHKTNHCKMDSNQHQQTHIGAFFQTCKVNIHFINFD